MTDRPWDVPPPLDAAFASERFVDAFRTAVRMHAGQTRWDPNIPFVSHLLGTCAIALEHGASEDQAIAALFHDAIEDVEPTDEVRATIRRFGDEVLRIVEACTDCDERPAPPWRECKERYLAAVPGHDRVSLLVSASDKLHNARRLVERLHRDGLAAWDRFDGGGADRLWYYRALVTAYRANPEHDVGLIDELDRTVTEMERIGAGGSRLMTDEHDHSAHDHEHHHEHEHHEHRPMEYADAVAQFRADKDAYFKSAPGSPIPAAEREAFTGLPYYPVDPAYYFEERKLEPYTGDEPSRFQIPTSDGKLRPAHRAGTLGFELGGAPQKLTAYVLDEGDPTSLFVPFLDATSGTETYGAGRYLDLEPEDDGTYILDFNLAYHPSCVYDAIYSCPLTPAENRLPVRVEAGERLPEG